MSKESIAELRKPIGFFTLPFNEADIIVGPRSDGKEGNERFLPTSKFRRDRDYLKLKLDYQTVSPVFPDARIANLPLEQRVIEAKRLAYDYWVPYFHEGAATSLFRLEEDHLSWEALRPDSLNLAVLLLDFKNRDKGVRITEKNIRMIRAKYRHPGQIHEDDQRRISALQQRTEQEKILRDAMLDVFTKDYFLKATGVESLRSSVYDIMTHTNLITEDDIQSLLQATTTRLAHLDNSENHARYFAYKTTEGYLSSTEQAAILRQNIEALHSEPQNAIDKTITITAKGVLQFYWNNLDQIFSKDEKAPMVAFVYDYLYSASLSSDLNLFLSASDWVLGKSRLLRERNKNRFSAEIRSCRAYAESDSLYALQRLAVAADYNGKSLDNFINHPTPVFLNGWIDEHRRVSVIGHHSDMLDSLQSAFALLAQHGRHDLYQQSGIYQDIVRDLQMDTDLRRLIAGIDRPLIAKLERERGWNTLMSDLFRFRNIITAYNPDFILLDALVSNMMDRSVYIARLASIAQLPQMADRTVYADTLEKTDFAQYGEPARTVYRTNILLYHMFMAEQGKSLEELTREKAANASLVDKITNSNMWFVAVNGDCFSDRLNPELVLLGITALIFYPDTLTGGYKIRLKTKILNEKSKKWLRNDIDIFMAEDGGLFYGFTEEDTKYRPTMMLPQWITIPLEKLISERLEFITSGRASTYTEPKGNDERKGAPSDQEAKRSFWRLLTSTPARPITLQSESAKQHAIEVLRDHGRDIVQVNIDRKRALTLAPEEFVTYVRGYALPGAPPNQLKYESQQ